MEQIEGQCTGSILGKVEDEVRKTSVGSHIAGRIPNVDSNEAFRDVMQWESSVSGSDHKQCEQIFMNTWVECFPGICGKLEWG